MNFEYSRLEYNSVERPVSYFGVPIVQKIAGLSHIKAGNTMQSMFSRSGSRYFKQDGESNKIYILETV